MSLRNRPLVWARVAPEEPLPDGLPHNFLRLSGESGPMNRFGKQWSRGDIHPVTGLAFWAYKKYGEQWIDASDLPRRREQIRSIAAIWVAKNRARVCAISRAWQKRNPHKVNSWRRARRKVRHLTDPLFRLRILMGNRIRKHVRQHGCRKNTTTFRVIGCTPAALRQHIEKQFLPGMTWANHANVWEIDHRLPLASAKSATDVLRLSHFSNLQPLWSEVNRAKRDRILSHG